MTRSRLALIGLLAAGGLSASAQNAATPAPALAPAADMVSFQFDDVEIRVLVRLVGEMTGRRFVVDEKVKGRVTVVAPEPVPTAEIYPFFLAILESAGYSVMEDGGVHRVIALPPSIFSPGAVSSGGGTGIVTRILKLNHVGAVEVKKAFESLVRGGKEGALAAFSPSNHLIVTDTAENVARLEKILAELDRPGAGRTIEVVPLKFASAEDLARDLAAAIAGADPAGQQIGRRFQQVAEGGAALPSGTMVLPAARANSLVLVGPPVEIAEIKRVIGLLDVEPGARTGRMNAIFLMYLTAEDAAKSLNALLAKTVNKDQRSSIAVESSVANNALLVESSAADFELVKRLVTELDTPPQQVMVEVLIAEVDLGKSLDFGVELATIDKPDQGESVPAGRTRFGDGDTLMDAIAKGLYPEGLAFGVARGTYTTADGLVVPRIPIILRALAKDRDVKILSSVPLWAQNNVEASVNVVENIPILKSTIEGGAGTARDVIQNIERMDVGIKLKFTPHVNPNREVTLKLSPSIEAVVDQGSTATPFTPTVAKREVTTTITVPDRSTVVITGLMREDKVADVAKVPLLGDIPVLGRLFRRDVTRTQRTNLLIFVTPHIVSDMTEAASLQKMYEDRTDIRPGLVTNRTPAAKSR